MAWFDKNGRSFVWRNHREPFVVLIAEMLLKKTSAHAVNQFLPHFLDRYGDVSALDSATLKELQEVLAPLGLSAQRGKQLKRLARALVHSHHGAIPNDREELLQLPGIGQYTAGAILSFAHGKPEAIVDTNVARIITRLYGIEPSRYEARRSPEIWEKARQLIEPAGSSSYKINWALLDLGALICRARKTRCGDCPLKSDCAFLASQDTDT
ncbi:MAG: hypothetical protein ACLFVA_04045 [Dehalococcoidia bacterium]